MALESTGISIANVNNGTNGQTLYTWVKYATTPTTGMSDDPTGKDYIGLAYNKATPVETDNYSDYTWSLIKGSQGVPGTPGTNGQTLYTWIKYATTPTSGMSDDPTGKPYIGLAYNKITATESDNYSDYTWSLIQGPQGVPGTNGTNGKDGIAGKDGVGITSTTISYTQSTSGTVTPTSGWQTQVPTLVKGQYLWTRTVWTYSDATSETGYSVSYNAKDGNNGADGIPGKDGVGITSTIIEYATSTSGTVKPTTGWSTQVPVVTPGNYLWTRTTWQYSDSTSEQGFSVTRFGTNGTNGSNGVSVVAVEAEYTQSTSGTIQPTTGWSSNIPQAEVGKYMWTRTRNVLSNGNRTAYVYTVTLNGKEGVIISETAPTNPSVGTLWQKPSDATKTVLEWNGTAWVNWGISVDNIVAENLTANNGVFEKVTGMELEGGVIRNPYVRTYNDNNVATGSIVLADNQYTNSGYIFNPANQSYRVYSQEIGPQFISMNMYSASDPNTQTGLLNSAALTYDLLTLTDVAGGFSGILSARQLTSTLWQNLTLNSGFATSEGNTCQYRITYDLQNNTVIQLRGQVQRTSGTMTGTTYPFAAVPVPLRTSKNYFAAGIGDTERLQTTRLGIINSAHPTAANMIQIKHWGDSKYVDISGLSYLAG